MVVDSLQRVQRDHLVRLVSTQSEGRHHVRRADPLSKRNEPTFANSLGNPRCPCAWNERNDVCGIPCVPRISLSSRRSGGVDSDRIRGGESGRIAAYDDIGRRWTLFGAGREFIQESMDRMACTGFRLCVPTLLYSLDARYRVYGLSVSVVFAADAAHLPLVPKKAQSPSDHGGSLPHQFGHRHPDLDFLHPIKPLRGTGSRTTVRHKATSGPPDAFQCHVAEALPIENERSRPMLWSIIGIGEGGL